MIRKKKISSILFFYIAMGILCTGCQMEKVSITPDETEKTELIKVDLCSVDYDKLCQSLVHKSFEDCQKKKHSFYQEKSSSCNGDCTFDVLSYSDEENHLLFNLSNDHYCDANQGDYNYLEDNKNIGESYVLSIDQEGYEELHFDGNRLRADYPREDIDACSKEEAIEKCSDLAEALGYDSANIETYGMTVDALNHNYENSDAHSFGQPEEGTPEEQAERYQDTDYKYKKWTKEYEAVYLIYRSVINGKEVDNEINSGLRVIYAPKYKRIVHAEWSMPFYEKEKVGTISLISKDDAIQFVRGKEGTGNAEDFEISYADLVYSVSYNETLKNESHTLLPVWRIDYHIKNSARFKYNERASYRTTLVNAITGKEFEL